MNGPTGLLVAVSINILDRQQSKTLILSTNVDKNARNRVFDCPICPNNCRSKTLFLAILYLCLSIFKRVYDCPQSGVIK